MRMRKFLVFTSAVRGTVRVGSKYRLLDGQYLKNLKH